MKKIYKDPYFWINIVGFMMAIMGLLFNAAFIIIGFALMLASLLAGIARSMEDIHHQQLLTMIELVTIEEELKTYCHRDAKLMEAMNRDNDQIIADVIRRRLAKLRKSIL